MRGCLVRLASWGPALGLFLLTTGPPVPARRSGTQNGWINGWGIGVSISEANGCQSWNSNPGLNPGPCSSHQELADKRLPASDTRASTDGLAALCVHSPLLPMLWTNDSVPCGFRVTQTVWPAVIPRSPIMRRERNHWTPYTQSPGPGSWGFQQSSLPCTVLTDCTYVWWGVWQWGRDSCTFYSIYHASIWISFTMSILKKNFFLKYRTNSVSSGKFEQLEWCS